MVIAAAGKIMDKQQFQERVQGVMQDVELDEATRHQECPDDTTGAALFHLRSGITNATQNARRVFRMDDAYNRYDMKVISCSLAHLAQACLFQRLFLNDVFARLVKTLLSRFECYRLILLPKSA